MRWIVFSILFLTSVTVGAHPFYISIFTVNYNEASQALQITVKVFSDDLEEGVQSRLYEVFKLENKNAAEKIEKYLLSQLKIEDNTSPLELKFLGFESDLDVTYLYAEVEQLTPPQNLTFSTYFLTDIYPEQSNIFHFTMGETKESFSLSKNLGKKTIVIDKQ